MLVYRGCYNVEILVINLNTNLRTLAMILRGLSYCNGSSYLLIDR